MITVLGYGSLLSEQSARLSAPSLSDFRHVYISNFVRVFNKVGIYLFRDGVVTEQDSQIAVCAARSAENKKLCCSAFECPDQEFSKIFDREHRYKWAEVTYTDANGNQGIGRLATEWSDREYLINRCGSSAEYERRVGQYYSGKIWREDILPHPNYLKLCLMAAESHSDEYARNFAECSYLADGETTIGEYIALNPEVLDVEPRD